MLNEFVAGSMFKSTGAVVWVYDRRSRTLLKGKGEHAPLLRKMILKTRGGDDDEFVRGWYEQSSKTLSYYPTTVSAGISRPLDKTSIRDIVSQLKVKPEEVKVVESQITESNVVKSLADAIRKTKEYALGIGRATALYKARGDYDGSVAYKMALHIVPTMAKRIHGPKYYEVYTPEVREQVQKLLAKYAVQDADKFNPLLPKKYQKGFKGYDKPIKEAEGVNFKKDREKLEPAAPDDSKYMAKGKSKNEDGASEYPFKLDQVQAYFDLQLAQGLNYAESVVKVRDKFGIKALRVSPAGEIQPVEGLEPMERPVMDAQPSDEPEDDPQDNQDPQQDDNEPDDGAEDEEGTTVPEHYLKVVTDLGYVAEGYAGSGYPPYTVLKNHKEDLTDAERAEAKKKKAVWGDDKLAVWKAVVGDKVWYVTNTHRAFDVAKTLDGAISRFHKFIKRTA